MDDINLIDNINSWCSSFIETYQSEVSNNSEDIPDEYAQFYSEIVESIKVYNIYINKKNTIEAINKHILLLDNGVLSKKNLVELINTNKSKDNINYKLVSLLKYNIDIKPERIYDFLENKLNIKFLLKINTLKDIVYNKTITFFQDINSLYIIFYEKDNNKINDNTFNNQDVKTSSNLSKKIHITHKKHKSTQKVIYK